MGIKYGDPNNLEDYKGGRTYDDLKKFADENLGPSCGPNNLDLCDAEKKATIQKFMAMSADELAKKIADGEADIEKVESDFKKFVDELQKSYETKSKEKDDQVAAIKNSGLGYM